MRILMSNDDGIDAPGIRAFVEAIATLRELEEIVVVAPDRQRSASSHGISLYQRLYPEKVDYHLAKVTAYKLSGTPVDCVKWAVSTQVKNKGFDLMLSGINEGPNLASDVLYSGTVAAAGEAALQHIPALAFSLVGPEFDFRAAAKESRKIVTRLTDFQFPPDTFLNINLPGTLSENAWVVTELGVRSYRDEFRTGVDDDGRTYYRYHGEVVEETGGDKTDVRVVERNQISITPLRYEFTNHQMIGTLASWLSAE